MTGDRGGGCGADRVCRPRGALGRAALDAGGRGRGTRRPGDRHRRRLGHGQVGAAQGIRDGGARRLPGRLRALPAVDRAGAALRRDRRRTPATGRGPGAWSTTSRPLSRSGPGTPVSRRPSHPVHWTACRWSAAWRSPATSAPAAPNACRPRPKPTAHWPGTPRWLSLTGAIRGGVGGAPVTASDDHQGAPTPGGRLETPC